MSVLELLMSFSPYLRSAMVRFPLQPIHFKMYITYLILHALQKSMYITGSIFLAIHLMLYITGNLLQYVYYRQYNITSSEEVTVCNF